MPVCLLDFEELEEAATTAQASMRALTGELLDKYIGNVGTCCKLPIDTISVSRVLHCPCCDHRLVVGCTETDNVSP